MPRNRSRSRSRERRRSRSRDRETRRRHGDHANHESHKRHRSRSPQASRRRSRSPRRRSRSGSREYESKGKAPLPDRPKIDEAQLEGMTEEDADMMRTMGFAGFDSTKGKQVDNNNIYVAKLQQKRRYRQYMNRRGGFNRPLDFIA